MTKREQKLYSKLMIFIRNFFFFLFLFIPVFSIKAFFDVSSQDPQFHIFSHLRDTQIMKGYLDGNFYPEKNVTRAEALTIALRAGGINTNVDFTGETYFLDVNPNEWYASVIARGVETKIILNKNHNFYPNKPVSKAEFLAFLFRATKVDFSSYFGQKNIAKDIPDEAWFVPHFSYAKKYQIAHLPLDNFYRPFKTLSRREVAMMTFRQLKIFHGNTETKLLIELQAEVQQFLALARDQKASEAEFHLHRILELNDHLTRTKNNSDAIMARALSRSMENLSESLRYFKKNKTLSGIERLHLALKQAKKASQNESSISNFAKDLVALIDETLISFTNPNFSQLSQR